MPISSRRRHSVRQSEQGDDVLCREGEGRVVFVADAYTIDTPDESRGRSSGLSLERAQGVARRFITCTSTSFTPLSWVVLCCNAYFFSFVSGCIPPTVHFRLSNHPRDSHARCPINSGCCNANKRFISLRFKITPLTHVVWTFAYLPISRINIIISLLSPSLHKNQPIHSRIHFIKTRTLPSLTAFVCLSVCLAPHFLLLSIISVSIT